MIQSAQQSALDRAKIHFPKMPDRVFELWLQDYVKEYGWEFEMGNEATADTVWNVIFRQLLLTHWAELDWHLFSDQLSNINFSRQSMKIIKAMRLFAVTGRNKLVYPVRDLRKRFDRCKQYVHQHDRFPAPLVLHLDLDASLSVEDGHHRLATVAGLKRHEGMIVEYWCGVHPSIAHRLGSMLATAKNELSPAVRHPL